MSGYSVGAPVDCETVAIVLLLAAHSPPLRAGGSGPIACYLQLVNISVGSVSLGHNPGFWITGLRSKHGHYDRGRNPNLGNAQIRALATDLRQGGGSPPHNVRMWGLLLVVSNNSE